MFLFINTTHNVKLVVALYAKNGAIAGEREVSVSHNESEQLLKAIGELRGMQSVKGIVVVSGEEGRFSALRTGIACANALGFAWNVPVRGVDSMSEAEESIREMARSGFMRFEGPVAPCYAREPNIT